MLSDPAARAEIDLAAGIFTGLLQRHVPGLVAGLHIVGSAALGDFRPGQSDMDFVAVLARPASDDDIEALVILHRLYAADPTLPLLDGIWIAADDLAAGPDRTPDGPTTQGSTFVASARGNRTPVTWHELQHGLAVLGRLEPSTLWLDRARLVAWTRQNAQDYWIPWLARRRPLFTPPGIALLGRHLPMWGVLGISRLRYTVATGEITSKTGAGQWALGETEPRWQPILEDCLATRRGAPGCYANPFARRRDALAYIGTAIAEIGQQQRPSD